MDGFGTPLRPEEIQRGLETKRLGGKIYYFAEIDSTNVFARKRAQEGGLEGEVVIADSQTRGRGRLGRNWISPPCVNLYLSVILRPRLAPLHAPQITLMSAAALAETVRSFVPFLPEIKWPNDILVGGKKLAGILTESSCNADKILFVVLGIGVNLNFPRDQMPEAIRDSATSIMILTQSPVDRVVFARQLLLNLDRCYGELEEKGFPWIVRRWEGFFRLKNFSQALESFIRDRNHADIGIDRREGIVADRGARVA